MNDSQRRRRTIILPHEIDQALFDWHGGQGSAVYALASTGMHHLVSISMIDAAIKELERDRAYEKSKRRHASARDLGRLIGELEMIRSSPREFSAEEAGLEYHDEGYDLARSTSALYKNPSRAVPGIAGWDMFAGGTSAAPGKHSYAFNMGGHQHGETAYHIDPVSNRHGRHQGYQLKAFGVTPSGRAGWFSIMPNGEEATFLTAPLYRSPAQAASAARRYAARAAQHPIAPMSRYGTTR